MKYLVYNIDSGNTLCDAAVALANANAYEVRAYATGGIF
jgi:phosphoribosylpyrophosphate synthetase